jgi:hypothetical protein
MRQNPFSLDGSYINVNYEDAWLAETPSSIDTLRLFEDGTFRSNYWGDGTYKTKWKLRGGTLELSYDRGSAGYDLVLSRELWFGKPKFIVSRDLNYHYKKID